MKSFLLTLTLVCSLAGIASAQTPPAPAAEQTGTSTDLFVMVGSDFVRPGLEPKANYNI